MKLCSWAAGCAQEISSHTELCEYHVKVSGGLLGDSGEAGKAAGRLSLRRQQSDPGRRRRAPRRPEPKEETTMGNRAGAIGSGERNVYFEPPHYTPDEIDAVLSDGTHLKATYQLGGRRLGFDRALPVGTLILLAGVRGWVVGSPGPADPPTVTG